MPGRMHQVSGIGKLSRVVFDAQDAYRLAAFYAELTEWPPSLVDDGPALRSPAGPALAFQPAPDHRPPRWPGNERPARIHLDLDVEALDLVAARAEALEATELARGSHWRTFADPAGHPFDLYETTSARPMSRLWVSIDVPDPTTLARFYSNLLGLEITHDNEVGAAIGAGGPVTIMFQQVPGYRPPRWPDPAHPQQAHLDVDVADLPAARSRVIEMGGVLLDEHDDSLVIADPASHPFCLRLASAVSSGVTDPTQRRRR